LKQALLIDGGIIAGGQGHRLSGVDKGLLVWQGKTYAEHISNRLRPHSGQLIINCNRNHSQYQALADQVVVDQQSESLGPLAGLQALLMASRADYLLVSPCDTPALPDDYGKRMLDCLKDNAGCVIAVSDGERSHPLHLLLPVNLVEDITSYLAQGGRKMMSWIMSYHPIWCDFSDEKASFLNINTPKEGVELDRLSVK